MRCIIVGDGPSARGFVPPEGITIIAVKRAITWLARADYWFSLDPNVDSMSLMEKRREGVSYYIAAPDGVAIPAGVERLGRVERQGIEPAPVGSPEWWMWRWRAVTTLSEEMGRIHSGNSAWGALGLAYHLGFRDVLLVGVDATDDSRVSDGAKPNNLSHLPLLFASAMNQVSLSSVSDLGPVRRTTLQEWLS